MGCEQAGRCWLWYQEVTNHSRCWFVQVLFASLFLQGTHSPSEDELVSLDELQETIAEFEDYVQSTDIAAMQSMQDVYPVVCRLTDVSRALDSTCLDVCVLGKEVEQVNNVVVRQRCDVGAITSSCFAILLGGSVFASWQRRFLASNTRMLQAVCGDLNGCRPRRY